MARPPLQATTWRQRRRSRLPREALGVEVTLRGDAQRWIRVFEQTDKPPTRLRPGVFEFRAIGRATQPARPP